MPPRKPSRVAGATVDEEEPRDRQRPVVVPRVHDLGEHVDNHQVAFARHMAAQDQIDVAEDEAALVALLDAACQAPGSRRIEPYVVQSSETAACVGALVEDLVRSGRR